MTEDPGQTLSLSKAGTDSSRMARTGASHSNCVSSLGNDVDSKD